MLSLDALDFEKGGGVVTVVCQDHRTGAVLMVAQADREALERTLATGEMHYRSRTRGLWHKGATSGHVQRVVSLMPDCDGDAVLARVVPAGPACHTLAPSCFGEAGVAGDMLGVLAGVVRARQTAPAEGSYTTRLLEDGNLRLKKLGEEATELVMACTAGDSRRATEEAADLAYHCVVALAALGLDWAAVQAELARRQSR